jgi:hypothetical protein
MNNSTFGKFVAQSNYIKLCLDNFNNKDICDNFIRNLCVLFINENPQNISSASDAYAKLIPKLVMNGVTNNDKSVVNDKLNEAYKLYNLTFARDISLNPPSLLQEVMTIVQLYNSYINERNTGTTLTTDKESYISSALERLVRLFNSINQNATLINNQLSSIYTINTPNSPNSISSLSTLYNSTYLGQSSDYFTKIQSQILDSNNNLKIPNSLIYDPNNSTDNLFNQSSNFVKVNDDFTNVIRTYTGSNKNAEPSAINQYGSTPYDDYKFALYNAASNNVISYDGSNTLVLDPKNTDPTSDINQMLRVKNPKKPCLGTIFYDGQNLSYVDPTIDFDGRQPEKKYDTSVFAASVNDLYKKIVQTAKTKNNNSAVIRNGYMATCKLKYSREIIKHVTFCVVNASVGFNNLPFDNVDLNGKFCIVFMAYDPYGDFLQKL